MKSLNKAIRENIKKLEQIIEILLKFSEVKARFIDYEKEIYDLLKVAIKLVKADGASILLYEDSNLSFKYVISKYRRKLLKFKMPVGRGIASQCFEKQKPIILKHAPRSKLHFKGVDKTIGYTTNNILALPLSTEEKRIGVIEFVNLKNINSLFEEELKLLQIFANRFCELILIHETYMELRKTQELIDKEKRKYTNIIDSFNIGILVLDPDNRGLFLNSIGEKLLKLNRFDLVNEKIKNVIRPEHEKLLEPLLINDESRHGKVVDIKIYTPAGEVKIFSVTPYWLYDVNKNLMLKYITFSDVTDYLRLKELSTWREMARYLAHELKNPLTPMRMYAELLTNNSDQVDSSFLKKYGELLIEQVERMNNLIESFHQFAKIDNVVFKRKDLIKTIKNVIEMYDSYDGISITFNTNKDQIIMRYDPDKMAQVFINLIKNSIEALEGKGEISINVVKDKGRVRIEMIDTGPGVPAEYRERLFLPQFTTKKTGKGLGLALVSRIISLHNGTIKYDPNFKQGAKFIIEFKI